MSNKPRIVSGQPDDNEPTTPTPPQFNIEALRLSQDFEQSLAIEARFLPQDHRLGNRLHANT